MKKTFEISVEDAGSNAFKFVRRNFPNIPLMAIHRLFRKRDFRKNGCCVGEKEILERGDTVTLFVSDTISEKSSQHQEISSEVFDREIRVSWEDEDFVVLNKKSGTPVHSGSGAQFGIIDIAQRKWKNAHLAHRLDRETSGVILLAKNGEALRKILPTMPQWIKEYQALLFGKLSTRKGTLDAPLPSRENPNKIQSAITHFEVESEYSDMSFVNVRLETGRTHQIRRHFADVGNPLVGDSKYGDFKKNRAINARRLFLHAQHLKFPHPILEKWVSVNAPLPEDIVQFLKDAQK